MKLEDAIAWANRAEPEGRLMAYHAGTVHSALKVLAAEVSRLTTLTASTAEKLAAAEREVERLTAQVATMTADGCRPAEECCELCQPLTDMHQRAEAAEAERDRYKAALEQIASGTSDNVPPFRAAPAEVLRKIAAGELRGFVCKMPDCVG